MAFLNDSALLIFALSPVVAVVAINVVLWLNGERDTLLLPGASGYPAVPLPQEPAQEAVTPAAEGATAEAQNDAGERLAA